MPLLSQRFELRTNEPLPTGSNTSRPDLVFSGRPLIEVEQEWPGTYAWTESGNIVDRVAVYCDASLLRKLRRKGLFVAEERRYNVRQIVGDLIEDPPPLLSRAARFDSVQLAVEWLHDGTICESAAIRDALGARASQYLKSGRPAV